MTPKPIPEDKNIKRAIDKVMRLRQHDEVWEGTGRIGRMWITPKNKPSYRPYMIMFVSSDKSIVRSKLVESLPTPERMFEELLNAMRRQLFGKAW